MSETESSRKKSQYTYSDFERVLITPFFFTLKENLNVYFADLLSFAKVPPFIGIIYCCFMMLQLILSVILFSVVNNEEDDFFSAILKLISPLLCGGGFHGGYHSILTSTVSVCVDLTFYAIVIWRAYHYKKVKSISSFEETFVLIISKYLIPPSLPFVISGIPYAAMGFWNGEGKAVYLVLSVVCFLVFVGSLFMIYFYFSPRVMFTNDFLNEWDSLITLFIPMFITLSSISVVISQYQKQKVAKMGMVIAQFVYFLVIYLYTIIKRPLVNSQAVKFICTISGTCVFMSIVNIISLYVHISSIIYVLIFIVLFVVVYFVNHLIDERRVEAFIHTLDEFEYEPTSVTPNQLAIAIKGTMHLYLPSIYSFDLIERVLNNNNTKTDNLLIVYARVIACFPHYNHKLKQVIKDIRCSDIPTRRILSIQLETISKRRNTAATPEVISFLRSVDAYRDIYEATSHKFWTNIIGRNNNNFWHVIDNISENLDELTKEINNIKATYENTPEVVSKIIKVDSEVTYQFDELPCLFEDVKMFNERKPAHPDYALLNFMNIFPNVINISDELSEEIKINDFINDSTKNMSEEYDSKRQIFEMIKQSKVGKSGFMIVFLFLATIAVAVVTFLMYYNFTDMVRRVKYTTDVYYSLDTLLLNVARYGYLFYEKQILAIPTSPMQNDEETMKRISPNWYGKYPDIPKLTITDKEIQELSEEIKASLSEVATKLPEIDNKRDYIKVFNHKYLQEKIPDVGMTIPDAILDLLIKRVADEKFIQQVFGIFEKLKKDLIEFAETTEFGHLVEGTNFYMIIVIICNVLLVSFPVMFRIFYTMTQMSEIADAFITLPVNDLREKLGKKDGGQKNSDDNSAALTRADNFIFNSSIFVLAVLTIFPTVILCIIFFFFCMMYVQNVSKISKGAAYIKMCTSTVRVTYLLLIQAFQEAYIYKEPVNAEKQIVKDSMAIVISRITDVRNDIIKATTVLAGQFEKWIAVEDDYRTRYPPLDENWDKIPACGAGFERLSYQKWTHALDNLVFFLNVTFPGDKLSMMYYEFESYFLWWIYDHREVPFYNTITTALFEDLSENEAMIYIVVFIIIFIVVSYIASVSIFNNYRKKINVSLQMLLQLSPETILQNEPIMSILLKGRYSKEDDTTFKTCNTFVKYVNYGIAKIDKNLDFNDCNPTFEKMFKDIENLNDLKPNPEDEKGTLKQLILNVRNIFDGKVPHIDMKVSVVNGGITNYFNIELIGVVNNRLLQENDNGKVTYIIMIAKDVTENVKSESIIKENQEELTLMLRNALPNNIVSILHKGQNTISFNVHSITMGEIRVHASRRFEMNTNEPHKFYNKVYKAFDRIIENYPILSKIRTFAHNYTFAGGLFMDVNKPEKHAEETIRFLIDVIKHIDEISKICETEVSLGICVHTGGPVVAGIMSIEMPSFIVLGDIHKNIHELKVLDEKNVIHITRTVYELIFSAGFNIAESESIEVDGERIVTYTVYP